MAPEMWDGTVAAPDHLLDDLAAEMARRVHLGVGDVFTMDGVRYHVDAVEPVEGEPRTTAYRVSAL